MFLTDKTTKTFKLKNNNDAVIFGVNDANLTTLSENFDVQIHAFGDHADIKGADKPVHLVYSILHHLEDLLKSGIQVGPADVMSAIQSAKDGKLEYFEDLYNKILVHDFKGKAIRVRNLGQRNYIEQINKNDVTFGIGPAGTGKTYLAVVMAVAALKQNKVSKLILTRPAVEAGENLGFLPGDLQEKFDPYLRPIYDALYDIMGAEHTNRLLERGVIEIAPLAYMRGRTLEDAFVILDESQNTTREQMKMFLTRLGFGSKMVVNGDLTQIDLPSNKRSGLMQVSKLLRDLPHIGFVDFKATDVVRHPVVAEIINAYDNGNKEK